MLLLLVFCFTTLWLQLPAKGEADSPAEEPASSTAEPVFCLRTERYPLDENEKGTLQSRMLREIARQAVLLAAREELGLATRDETLGEPLSTPNNHQPGWLALTFRVYPDGSYELHLVFDDTDEGDPEDGDAESREIWTHRDRLPAQECEMYGALVEQLSAKLPGIADALREAGLEGTPQPFISAGEPLTKAEQLLGEMNFVSQYATVRAAHQAISSEGPSATSLGVLVRGYAHLSALTHHLWSTHTEAFAARSLMYAEMLARLGDDVSTADWHRAYAHAILGMHGTALAQLDAPDQSGEDQDGSLDETIAAEPTTEAPAWTRIIRPYCEFEHEPLEQLSSTHPDLEQVIAFLRWEHYRAYQHGRWIYEKGLEAFKACPEAYSVYSAMANWSALRIKRVGASAGMQVFENYLPARVAALDDLPPVVQHIGSGGGFLSRIFGGGEDDEEGASDRGPMQYSRALMKYTRQTDSPADPSWGILGSLIAEEQFVQIANMMRVSQDGVERSNAELVDHVLPLIEEHRYANYIRSFALPTRPGQHRLADVLSGMNIVDPRGNMHKMFDRLWYYHAAPHYPSGKSFSLETVLSPTLTLAGVIETAYGPGSHWSQYAEASDRRRIAAYCRESSPRSPIAFVLGMQYAEDVDIDKLASWETEAGDNPVAWLSLGAAYYKQWETDASARCYKRSLEISASFAATEGLANSYFYGGKEELFVPTLESYLEFEDLGLAHAQIRQRIANHLIEKRKWAEALPHAEAAAQTWSAWGLLLAGRVHEGLQNWEESEYWMSEASSNYPSYSSGMEWYLWCRRTGRGRLESAQELAEKWVALPANLEGSSCYYVGTYHILEDQPEPALRIFQNLARKTSASEDAFDKVCYLGHVVLLAKTVREQQLCSDSIKSLRRLADGPVKNERPKLVPVIITLCDLLQGETADGGALDELYNSMNELPPNHRCNYSYFLGAALEEMGQTDKADAYFQRAAF